VLDLPGYPYAACTYLSLQVGMFLATPRRWQQIQTCAWDLHGMYSVLGTATLPGLEYTVVKIDCR
jgi:hypothetical protein